MGRHAMLSVISRDIPIISAYSGLIFWGAYFGRGLLSDFYFVINSLFQ